MTVFAIRQIYPKQFENIKKAPTNYLDAAGEKHEVLKLNIKTKYLFEIENNIHEALHNNHFDGIKTYYSGKMKFRKEKYDIKFRLKGDQYDHYNSEKYSLRIKAYQDSTLKRVFSIQHPKTRNYLNEYVFHQLLKYEGLNYLDYQFLGVHINDVFNGIYAYEEHFLNPTIDDKWGKNGFIMGFNDEEFWTEGEPSERDRAYDTQRFLEAEIKTYGASEEDISSMIKKLDMFRKGSMAADQLFDMEQMGRFYAICDLSGARHALRWINVRYFYNKQTNKLEPVGFDSNSGKLHALMVNEDYINPILHKQIINSGLFKSSYNEALNQIAKPAYLDNFFQSIEKELIHNLRLVHKDHPVYNFNRALWYDNQNAIKGFLK